MATSPKPDATLIANLKANVRRLRAALDASEEHCTMLAASVFALTPPDDATVLGAVTDFRPTPAAVERAHKAIAAWQEARTGQGVVVAAYEQDPTAKFVGNPYDPKKPPMEAS